MKTILQQTKPCPNGIIALSLRLSDWLWKQTTNKKVISDEQLDKVAEVMYETLNQIEKLLNQRKGGEGEENRVGAD